MFSSMKYVYEVYKERSFSKAAQNLYISQPSLSATIKKAEDKIGAPIFDRSTNPIQLTEVGKQYIKSLEEIMDIQNSFDNYVNNLNELKTGQLSIGGSNFFTSFILPPLITEFTHKYPLVKIHLLESDTASLKNMLLHGSLDLVIDNYDFYDPAYTTQFFAHETLILAVPKRLDSNTAAEKYQLTYKDIINKKHLKEKTPTVPLKFFENDPFIFLRTGNDTRRRAEKICEDHKLSPKVILKLDQQITSYNVACYGMGIAFVSDTLIHKTKPDPNIIYYKLDDPYAKRNIYFYYKQSKYVTRAMEEFLKIVDAGTITSK